MILPFRGLRFNLQKVRIEDVVSQPYDVITKEMQDRYYQKSPYNIVRVILNKDNDRYDSAKRCLDEWLSSGVFIIEDRPAVYLYEQQFSVEGTSYKRRGFISLVKLCEFEEGIIFPHEHTLSAPKEDRYKLTVATNTHWGQVFLLYSDSDKKVEIVLSKFYEQKPEFSFKDEFEVRHTFWVIKDAELLVSLKEAMGGKKFIIADGHHRYETALRYKRFMNEKAGPGPWDYRVATLVAFEDPGLVILPIHRLLKLSNELELGSLNKFDIFKVEGIKEMKETLLDAFERGISGVFGVFDRGNGFYCMKLKNTNITLSNDDEHSKQWHLLDVNILQNLVIEPLFGMNIEDISRRGNVGYETSFEKAEQMVESGNYDVCFFLNPVRKDQIMDISFKGERLPQKSTFFYPKILTGMVEQYMGIGL